MGTLGGVDNEELWGAVSATMCGSKGTWDLGVVRAVVAWVADPHEMSVDETGTSKCQLLEIHCSFAFQL
jgi:telomere length regulation protein